jgi:hypothetical protein
MDPSVLNHNLMYLPNVRLTPHSIRRAFATYGNEILQWDDEDSALVLDHKEGRVGKTIERYNWTQSMDRKFEMLSLWREWVDREAEIAIDKDPILRPENRERLAYNIYKYRYDKNIREMKKLEFGSLTSNDEEMFAIDEAIELQKLVSQSRCE